MSGDESQTGEGQTARVEHEISADIHLCKWCSEAFEPGDDVVCLSDGLLDEETNLDVRSHRFWHRECWIEDITGQYNVE